MKPTLVLLSCLFTASLCRNAWAQATPPVVSPVRAAQVAQLQAWGVAGKVETSSPLNLDVRAADLQAARATEPLQNWVRAGGIVILHTDAAQAFGFATVQARERTFNRAGQLWGRGGNALPFGGSPLLLGGRSQSRKGQTDGVPGVRTVFYQLDSGDALLRASGAAVVPLLRVEDNTLSEDGKAEPTFYAAGMRRYGRGWALFVPRIIEARADGAMFQQNLDAFIVDASVGKWRTLDVVAIQAAYKPASQRQTVDWQTLRKSLFPADDPKKLPVVSEDAQLIISVDDAKTIGSALKQIEAAPNDDGLQTSGRALVYLLAARALWQLDSDDSTPNADTKLSALWATSSAARETLWQTQSGGPTADMARWWNGVFALGAALPPIPTSYQIELIEFSYARPAFESAQWWRNMSGGDETLKKVVAQAGPAAQQMAQQHQDDPQLLSYWRTNSGTRYYLQLTPIQAASPKFPPAPQKWGMPRREFTSDNVIASTWLVPVGSEEAMPFGIVPQPIIWPEYNSVRPKLFWVFSQFWSENVIRQGGFIQDVSHVVMAPSLTQKTIYKSGITTEEYSGWSLSFVSTDAIYLQCIVHYPLSSWQAYTKQVRAEKTRSSENDYRRDYWVSYSPLSGFQETFAFPTPSRVARLQAHLSIKFWLDNATVPDWMDDGLENIFSLSIADVIERGRINVRDISPAPALAEMADRFNYSSFLSNSARYARVESSIAGDPEVEIASPALTDRQISSGTPLVNLDSTNQVSFFYQRFGAGAFVETLQRLGSGQSIDAALQATTGLTQRQFFAAANAN